MPAAAPFPPHRRCPARTARRARAPHSGDRLRAGFPVELLTRRRDEASGEDVSDARAVVTAMLRRSNDWDMSRTKIEAQDGDPSVTLQSEILVPIPDEPSGLRVGEHETGHSRPQGSER